MAKNKPSINPQAAIPDIESKKIQVADYNSIQAKVANVLGTSLSSNATFGWGQTIQSSPVSVSTKVGVSDWNKLKFDIINAWTHIYNTTPPLVTATQNNIVRGDTETSPYSQYDGYADSIVAGRFTVSPSQALTLPAQSEQTTWPGTYGTTWKTRLYATVSVSWPTAAEARHFFNSGGEIRFASSRSGGGTVGQIAVQNASWTNLLSSAGTQGFGGNIPSAGVSPTDGKNFYRLTNVFQIWYQKTASSPYALNKYRLSARTPSVANNSTGTASTIEFQIEWLDDHVPQGTSTADNVDGTITLEVSGIKAVGTLFPSGAGNFTITSPTITITQAPRP